MKKLSILVIDDEESICFTLERFLIRVGHRVFTAETCGKAKNIIKQEAIDLIFTDFVLPDGNGIEILKEVRQKLPACPVVIITAYPSIQTEREALCVGAYQYLSKPVRQEEVLQTINNTLQHDRNSKRTQEPNTQCRPQFGAGSDATRAGTEKSS